MLSLNVLLSCSAVRPSAHALIRRTNIKILSGGVQGHSWLLTSTAVQETPTGASASLSSQPPAVEFQPCVPYSIGVT
ncbi:hypothetical protein F5Y01DRAFT_295890 [Xylaria sp. FL0043]|nr:hypothetical protein F5Y01DRAFT_295890 [Xylaria sp. FL0043]